jgi:hypothetical protein
VILFSEPVFLCEYTDVAESIAISMATRQIQVFFMTELLI